VLPSSMENHITGSQPPSGRVAPVAVPIKRVELTIEEKIKQRFAIP
jgi:hypothetical protein